MICRVLASPFPSALVLPRAKSRGWVGFSGRNSSQSGVTAKGKHLMAHSAPDLLSVLGPRALPHPGMLT